MNQETYTKILVEQNKRIIQLLESIDSRLLAHGLDTTYLRTVQAGNPKGETKPNGTN